jgi:hypothetical protein
MRIKLVRPASVPLGSLAPVTCSPVGGTNRGVANAVPNSAFERTAASALRLLAIPSSLRSSAAAQCERWAA